MLSRSRVGWHVLAVGGSRRSAHNVGIPVRRVICATYVVSGTLAALAGVLFASRLGGAGADTGVGLEIAALTAAVLGGNSLGGGRGSAAKAVIGSITVMIMVNSLVRLGVTSGANSLLLGMVLLAAVAIDVRWLKNRHKFLSKVYVSPTYSELPEAPATSGSSPYALNDRLRPVEAIGLGQIDGPEDVILDEDDNIYVGNRTGDIVRFLAPDYDKQEVFAHVGGRPLGMAFAKDGALLVCIGGMGLYRIGRDREIEKLTDETNRSWFSVIDDSRLRLADDLDIAPDGRVFFSEATIRYEMHEWPVDCLESRGNGRIICYDPKTGTTRTVLKNLVFPNGICMTHDGQSFLFAETWACRVSRYWFDGPKEGHGRAGHRRPAGLSRQHQPRLRRQLLAGAGRHPDAVARPGAEDAGLPQAHGAAHRAGRMALSQHQHRLRGPLRRDGPHHRDAVGFRRREPSDDHLDARAQGPPLHRRHPQQPRRPAEARRHGPGLERHRVILEADMIGSLSRAFDNLFGRGDAAVTVPPLDGALRPNRLLDEAACRDRR